MTIADMIQFLYTMMLFAIVAAIPLYITIAIVGRVARRAKKSYTKTLRA